MSKSMSLYDLFKSGVLSTEDGGQTIVENQDVEVETEETPAAEEPAAETTETAESTEETTEETSEVTEEVVEGAGEDEGTGSDSVDTSEIETELVEVAEDQKEIQETEEQVEAAEDAAVAVEAYLDNLLATKNFGPGVNIFHAQLSHEYCNMVAKFANMPAAVAPSVSVSVESFSTPDTASLSTEGAIESAKGALTALIDAVLKGIAWLLDKGKQFLAKVFTNVARLQKYAGKLKEKAGKAGKLKEGKGKYKSSSHTLILSMGDKVASPLEAVAVLKKVATTLADYKQDVIAKEAVDVSKKAEKQLNYEKGSSVNETANNALAAAEASGIMANHDKIAKVLDLGGYTDVSEDEAKKVSGVLLHKDCKYKASPILPRNKRLVVSIFKGDGTDSDPDITTAHRMGNVAGKHASEREHSVMSVSDLRNAILGCEEILAQLTICKDKLAKTEPMVKELKGVITKINMSYVAFTKKQHGAESYRAHAKNVRLKVKLVKIMIDLLRKPLTDFIPYGVFEVKSLLDVCNYQLSQYEGAGSSDEAKPAEA